MVQVLVGIVLFTLVSVVLEKDYSTDTWYEKGKTALLFGLAYAIFLLIKERLRKKDKRE